MLLGPGLVNAQGHPYHGNMKQPTKRSSKKVVKKAAGSSAVKVLVKGSQSKSLAQTKVVRRRGLQAAVASPARASDEDILIKQFLTMSKSQAAKAVRSAGIVTPKGNLTAQFK